MFSRGLIVIIALLLSSQRTQTQELRVMLSGAFTEAYLQLVPTFEQSYRYTVMTSFGASMGGASDSIPVRLARGEPADVVIVAASALDDLTREGKVLPRSRVDLVRSSIGMAVRAGAPKPDISTVDALRRTLLAARSVAYSASASGAYISTELFDRLGIAEQMRGKKRRIESERVGAVIARGEADIGFQQISELLPVAGIDYVGPLPTPVQRATVFSAGIATTARNPDGAKALIEFLVSPRAVNAIVKSGLEPMAAGATATNR
jgi:molybdate transport system substrate-binding protein